MILPDPPLWGCHPKKNLEGTPQIFFFLFPELEILAETCPKDTIAQYRNVPIFF